MEFLVCLSVGLIPLIFSSSLFAQSVPIFYGDRSQPEVALTFDDGPHPDYTYEILRILDRYGVKSTFFVVGKSVKNYAQLVRDIVASGHDLANHSFTHQRLDRLSEDEITLELSATTAMIKQVTGETVSYFRPPGGRYNRRVLAAVDRLDLTMVMWDVNAADYYHKQALNHPLMYPHSPTRYQRPAALIIRDVLRHAKQGSIVLFHNIDGETLKSLPVLIDGLQQRGYRLVSLKEMLVK